MKRKMKLSPWQKIKRAVYRGTGCSLTAMDIQLLGMDDAIMTRAELDDASEAPVGLKEKASEVQNNPCG